VSHFKDTCKVSHFNGAGKVSRFKDTGKVSHFKDTGKGIVNGMPVMSKLDEPLILDNEKGDIVIQECW